MKCAVFKRAGEPLSIESVPDPTPGPGEIVIKVGRCGICGSDLKMTEAGSSVLYPAGSALGHEYAGEVAAFGRDVSGFRVGDRVTAMPTTGCGSCPACLAGEPIACGQCRHIMGGFGEYTLADARYVAKLPADLSLSDGALVEPLACGRHAVRLAGVSPAARVLVIGAGSVGLTVMYWARRFGCRHIVATARSERNAELARTMGASGFVRQGEALTDKVAEALGGSPDIVFECAGAAGLIGQAVDCVRFGGTIVSAGLCFDPEPFVSGKALMKQARILFSLAYGMDDFRQALDTLDAGFVEPRAMLGESIALAALPRRLEELRYERSTYKVMVNPWG